MTEKDCAATLIFGGEVLTCGLVEGHADATEARPSGTPHEASNLDDTLTGEPWKWWG